MAAKRKSLASPLFRTLTTTPSLLVHQKENVIGSIIEIVQTAKRGRARRSKKSSMKNEDQPSLAPEKIVPTGS